MEKKRNFWKGCLFGCLGLVVLMILFSVGIGLWLGKKGTFEHETTILAENSDYFLRLYLTADDPLLIDFVTNLANQANSRNLINRGLPEFFREWQQGQSRRDFLKMLPLEVELTGNSGESSFNGAAGFSLYNNIAKIIFFFVKRGARKEGQLYEHEGKEFIAAEGRDRMFFTLDANIAYLANTREGMEAMLTPGEATERGHDGDPRFRGLDLEAPFYGFLTGEATQRNWDDILDEDRVRSRTTVDEDMAVIGKVFSLADRVAFDLKVQGEDRMGGSLILDMEARSPERREAIVRGLEDFAKDSELSYRFDVREAETGYVVSYEITGFDRAIERAPIRVH